jgi:hypothetical protein
MVTPFMMKFLLTGSDGSHEPSLETTRISFLLVFIF